MSGSYWSYNGVELKMLRTHAVSTVTERDPSDTDNVWARETIRVQGVLFGADGVYTQFGTNPAEIYKNIKHLLGVDRAPFVFQYNGQDIVRVDTPPDANKGPKIEAEVTQLLEGSWLINATVTTWNAACTNSSGNGKNYVSHRYSQTEKFDQNASTVYSVKGRIIVRSDLRISADSLRQVGIPKIREKFIRTNMQFVLSEDGLTLDYSFEDRQQHAMPPSPATKASGHFQVYTADAAKWMGQVTVRLEGPPSVDRKVLLTQATKVAIDRLLRANVVTTGKPDKKTPIVSGHMTEGLYGEMAVAEVQLVGQLTNQNTSVSDMAKELGFGVTPRSTTRGIAPEVRQKLAPLLAAAFLDSCGADLSSSADSTGVTEVEIRTGPSSGVTPDSDDSPSGSTSAFSDDDSSDYAACKIEATYKRTEGRAQLPKTGTDATCAIVRMHNPMLRMEVAWTAKRRGLPPILPAYFSDDENLKEMDGTITPVQVEMSGDGFNPIYTVSGHYSYAVIDASKASILSPVPPFVSSLASLAAKETAGYLSNNILFRFKGSDGPNPFDKLRAASLVGKKPSGTLVDQIAGGALAGVLGVAGAIGANTPSSSDPPLNGQPPVNP